MYLREKMKTNCLQNVYTYWNWLAKCLHLLKLDDKVHAGGGGVCYTCYYFTFMNNFFIVKS